MKQSKNRSANRSAFLLVLWSLNLIPVAMGSDYQSPRTAALGGSTHASPMLTDAIYLNPSFGSLIGIHALTFNYTTYHGPEDENGFSAFHGHLMNISVIDGTTETLFQAGVGFTRREDSNLLHVGASKNFTRKFGVGIGGKMMFPHNTSPDQSHNRITDATISTTVILARWFQTALIIDNLFQSAKEHNWYRELTIGTRFNIMQIFYIYFDPNWVPDYPDAGKRYGYEAGTEFPFMSDFFLRFGMFRHANLSFENDRGNGYSAGFGWLAPRLSLDYALSRVISPANTTVHTFGATIYF